ncbi:MAG TPA: hypothetical protein ENK10_09590 [Acidobacteria bacterium]|nr:hypothetical protein [Acidobacteriota bacterium]
MRRYLTCLVVLAAVGWPLSAASGDGVERGASRPAIVIDASRYHPLIVFHDFGTVTTQSRIMISGVVFSRSSVDRVTLAKRSARLRPAEPADLVRLERVPQAAREAPYRVYFEFPDVELLHPGANDLDVRAMATDGRMSDLHRITVIRLMPPARQP